MIPSTYITKVKNATEPGNVLFIRMAFTLPAVRYGALPLAMLGWAGTWPCLRAPGCNPGGARPAAVSVRGYDSLADVVWADA